MNSNASEVSAANDDASTADRGRGEARRPTGGALEGQASRGRARQAADSTNNQKVVSGGGGGGGGGDGQLALGEGELRESRQPAGLGSEWLHCKRASALAPQRNATIQTKHLSAPANQFSECELGDPRATGCGGKSCDRTDSDKGHTHDGRPHSSRGSEGVGGVGEPETNNSSGGPGEARANCKSQFEADRRQQGRREQRATNQAVQSTSCEGAALVSGTCEIPRPSAAGGVCAAAATREQQRRAKQQQHQQEPQGRDELGRLAGQTLCRANQNIRSEQQPPLANNNNKLLSPSQARNKQPELVVVESTGEAGENSTFWTKLSNLSRSITHQQQQAGARSSRSRHQAAPAAGEAGARAALEGGDTFLAPEVVGYLESKKARAPQCSQAVARAANDGETGGNLLLLARAQQLEQAGQRLGGGDLARSRTTTMTTATQAKLAQAYCNDELAEHERPAQVAPRQEASVVVGGKRQAKRRRDAPGRQQVAAGCAESQRVSKTVELQRTINSKMRPQQQQEAPLGGEHELPAATRHRQLKAPLATSAASPATNANTATNENTTNTASTTTRSFSASSAASASASSGASSSAAAASSASSLSSCILSESTTARSDEEVRLKWDKKMDFLLSIIGFAVDLANIWRFPYLVYKNGGGVFLIPYLTMLIFGGIPLFFLELCLGQFVKKGPITLWNKICPAMKGVGYCSILISWYVSFYYNVLIAWSVYFIYRSILSFGQKMPWEDCDNSWNSRSTCVSISQLKQLCAQRTNETLESCRKDMFSSINVTSPASEFFVKELSQIDQSSGLDDMGYLRMELVVCTMIVYLLHYFSLFRGLETSGKVVWVTATAPYMILSILLVRGLFLPGASMGIEYYLSPRLEKLADPQVWIDAAGQVFYSIGVGFGVHLTYASFNSHDNNCYRDCLMTSAVNALTSVYSGLVVFVYLGYMATNLGIEIDKVASEGYSLVFEVYPEALTTLPFARFWSILFFIMLLTLGIDSAMGGLEAVITGLEDEFKFAKRLSRGQLTGLVIVSSFLPALISCTQGGAYTLFWFDIYSAGVSLLFSALFETVGVVYCYGIDKFILNIESMLGRKPQLFYILCWKYISPIFLMGIIFMSIYTASVPVYRGYTFPLWSIILGWCLAFSSVAAVPIVAIWTWCFNGTKAINVSPSKSPRKATVGGSESRNLSRKTTTPSQAPCKSMSVVNYTETGRSGSVSTGRMTTSSVINLPPDHQQQQLQQQQHNHHHHHHHRFEAISDGLKEEMV